MALVQVNRLTIKNGSHRPSFVANMYDMVKYDHIELVG